MDLEARVSETIITELKRQAEMNGALKLVEPAADGETPASLTLEGQVDLDALAMAVVGALAGGP